MNDFIYSCALSGFGDFFKECYKYHKPPKWMDTHERNAWYIGYKYAKANSN